MSCDQTDDDPATLWTAAASINSIAALGPTASQLLASSGGSIGIVPAFVAAIEPIGSPMTIVLDHLEHVSSRESFATLPTGVLSVKNLTCRRCTVQLSALTSLVSSDTEEHVDFRNDTDQRPLVILFCGLPGSGKTTLARERARETGAIRFSTDEWMADLGVDFFDPMRDNLQYRLNELWKELLEHGQSVILEDGTWTREERNEIRQTTKILGATTEMHYFDIAFDELWRRLQLRNAMATYGAAPITRELLEECRLRLHSPDRAELSLFDRAIVHS